MTVPPGHAHSGSDNASNFGRLLKQWRARRSFSQLDLAMAVRTTQRHVSFIESGRAAPSRERVLRLAMTMDLPLRQQNALLLAAGYAPAWNERDISLPELTPELTMVNRSRLHAGAARAVSGLCR